MDLDAQQAGQFGAGLRADFLEALAALAQHDGALAGAADQYLLVDFHRSVIPLAIFFRVDGGGIGAFGEIGRASCRERVCQSDESLWVAVALKHTANIS